METRELVPNFTPPSEVRVMSDTGEFSKTFDGIFVVGLGMPYKTRQKKWCSYDEFTRVDLFGSVLKMTSGSHCLLDY